MFCLFDERQKNEITDFKTAFHWGNPITLVQRGEDKENNSAMHILQVPNSRTYTLASAYSGSHFSFRIHIPIVKPINIPRDSPLPPRAVPTHIPKHIPSVM